MKVEWLDCANLASPLFSVSFALVVLPPVKLKFGFWAIYKTNICEYGTNKKPNRGGVISRMLWLVEQSGRVGRLA